MLKFILGVVVGHFVAMEMEKRRFANRRIQLIKLPDGSQCERRIA